MMDESVSGYPQMSQNLRYSTMKQLSRRSYSVFTNVLWLCLVTLWFVGCQTNTATPPLPPGEGRGEDLVSHANQTSLAAQLDTRLHSRSDTGAIVSTRFIDADTGEVVYETPNADYPFKPASNMKLLISAAGLDHFGPEYTFKTYLAQDGEDLWIIGTGDPGTGDPKIAKKYGGDPTTMLEKWADALKAKGITEIKGDLVYDDLIFDDFDHHPSWSPSDLLHWYAAPVAGLAFNDNCVDITVTPASLGHPAKYTVMPPVENITLINNTISGNDDAEHNPAIAKLPGGNVYELTGTVCKETALKSKPVENPGAFFAEALRTHLKSKGMTVQGNIRRAGHHLDNKLIPDESKTVAVHETKIEDILARINKPSQNLFAEMLCKAMGHDCQLEQGENEPGSWLNGNLAIRRLLQKAGINTHPLIVADGSGLSQNNRVTARMITELLRYMHNHENADVFFNSLTIGGVDGTLRKRFTDTPFRIRGKTGLISGVRALSGYIRTDAGSTVIFSILYNQIPGPVKPYEQLQDDAVRLVMHEYAP